MKTATPKKTATVEAAEVILRATAEKQLGIVALNKALFYLDLVCLRNLGHTATEGKYVALENGPVVSGYQRALVRRLIKLGLAKEVKVDEYGRPLKLIARLPHYDHISPEIVRIAQRVASLIEKHRAIFLSRFSHDNIGWQRAYEAGQAKGLPARVINLHVAMQQICNDDDPWMDDPLCDDAARASVGNLAPWI
jgi:hypothetical protein